MRATGAANDQLCIKTIRTLARAQYTTGTARGQPVRSYREEPNVDPGSKTETYVALRLLVDNRRWAGVPFYFALR